MISRKRIEPLLARWRADHRFKTMAGASLSFLVNILFVLYNGFLGIRLSSIWYGGICVYYFLLAAIRGSILLTERSHRAGGEEEKKRREQKTFLISAVMLLILNFALILPISLMVVLEKPVNIGLIPAITMATYTTYKISMASIHIRKQKRNGNILVVELRTISFIDALVSILTLQNTLIMVNRTEAYDGDMLALSAVSSAAIYLIIVWTTIRLLTAGLRIGQNRPGQV